MNEFRWFKFAILILYKIYWGRFLLVWLVSDVALYLSIWCGVAEKWICHLDLCHVMAEISSSQNLNLDNNTDCVWVLHFNYVCDLDTCQYWVMYSNLVGCGEKYFHFHGWKFQWFNLVKISVNNVKIPHYSKVYHSKYSLPIRNCTCLSTSSTIVNMYILIFLLWPWLRSNTVCYCVCWPNIPQHVVK